ncbi:hypothetical protein YA0871_21515 [Pseudomonas paralactis]|uniref:ABC transporter permease n=1 Tax=Pseudomonas paralactis TaxID=1615673 RepID=A0ABS0V7Y8_9PSED|nr:hypothetical protein [Pseudomonas paralactis]QOY74132.1 hypothetical protein IH404_11600 [Pseudomonas sp. OST1909]
MIFLWLARLPAQHRWWLLPCATVVLLLTM